MEFHGNYTSIEKCGRGKKGVVTWDNEHMGFYLLVGGLGAYDVATETDEWHYKREVSRIHPRKQRTTKMRTYDEYLDRNEALKKHLPY